MKRESCKGMCFWVLVVGLCCVGIPIHIIDMDSLSTDNSTDTGYNTSLFDWNSTESSVNETTRMVLFKSFVSQFNKTYGEGSEEFKRRYGIFKTNLEKASELNILDNDSASYGVTKFSDLTPEEFAENHLIKRKKFKYSRPPHLLKSSAKLKPSSLGLPAKIDWREKNVVGAVLNQETCGGCWAFSTVGIIESMNAIKRKKFYNLSIQQMLDCSGNGNMGCGGGDPCSAIEWMIQRSIRLLPAKKYPLTLRDQLCKITTSKTGVRLSSNYSCLNLEDMEQVILHLLATHGPVAVAVDSNTWQHYLGGIIRFHCGADQNHAVQIVGYDLTGSVPYYIVRNSWGKEFGLDGYLHIAIGKNLCGIANEVASVDVL